MDSKCSTSDMSSRPRRRLNVLSPPKAQNNECSSAAVCGECWNTSSDPVEPAPSTSASGRVLPMTSYKLHSEHGGGVSKVLDRRLTRSASKRWLKIYESSVSVQQDDVTPTVASSANMLPPPQPLVQASRPSSGGIVTRLRNRTLKNSRGSCTDVNKISQNLLTRLSFDQVSNTSDYGTASEHSRKCSVASGGMSPVSDSGNSCHCASMSGVESLGTSSEDDTPPHTNEFEWVDKTCAMESDDLRQPRITVHTVEGVSAFIPDGNRSGYSGNFTVTRRGVNEEEMYR